ncbi:right-handed parallel beta-helix repeat-containing protein [Calycomorphotria hydatis]|uniref:right-handed parallel beta-helix repeat-containing protein n=1 Tax=Calycomorphotria hydatis TaxID=2528027 RepID=UPI001E30D458|nr:right-handed parallel beta-helix repeat-containing protein [Calycomorphotria hydatis]
MNNVTGNDTTASADHSKPFRTINAAIRVAKAGDVISLTKTDKVYLQDANFYGHAGGEPGKPITLNGNGVTLRGSEVCSPEGWSEYQQETFQRSDLVSRVLLVVDNELLPMARPFDVIEEGEVCFAPNFFNRFYFHIPKDNKAEDFSVIVGQPDGSEVTLDPANWQRSHSKLPNVRRYQGLKPPTWVKVNGETVDLIAAKDRLEPNEWTSEDKVMYYRPPAGKKLSDVKIESMVRGNGVQLNGSQSHFVIKNLNVEHVYNDGFNIHGRVKDAVFLNCNAENCGDEGFSSHDACETVLDGAVYSNCDNGIANVNNSGLSVTRNVVISDSRSVGFLLISNGTAHHTLENAVLINNPSQLSAADMQADNVLIVKTVGYEKTATALNLGRNCQIKNVTAVGNSSLMRVGKDSSVTLEDGVFGPGQGVVHARVADPVNVLSLRNVLAGNDITMQWGEKYPWQEEPLDQWFSTHSDSPQIMNCKVDHSLNNSEIIIADVTHSNGCSAELINLYLKNRKE